MKIAMFGHKRVPSREGGVEMVVAQLSSRMAAMGHRVTCYNRAGRHVSGACHDRDVVLPGVRIRKVLTIDKKGLAAVTSSFFAAIRAAFSRADVVHIHAEGPAIMSWLPRLFGKRVVVTVHGLDWQREKWKGGFGARFIRRGERTAVKYAHEIIVLSRNVQEYFRQTYHRETVYIPNGVEQPQCQDAACITQTYGLQKEDYILFLGRLVPEKGIHYLIEAFQSIRTEKKLVIAGGVSDTDDYVRQLQEAAADRGNIIFTGFVQGEILEALYSNAYVYVLPSDLEGMPRSLLEAMSYGNCCLVSNISECAEVVEDKAVVFEKGNVADLAAKLQMLCQRPDLVASYQATARDYICEKYNWDAVTEKTLELYR